MPRMPAGMLTQQAGVRSLHGDVKILALTNLHLSLTSHAAFPKELVVPDENSLFDFDPWKAECCVVVGNGRRKG